MKIFKGELAPQIKIKSEEILNKLLKKYPEARGFNFSMTEDSHSFFTTTLEVRVGKKKLIAKKIGASANESIKRAHAALIKRLEKNLQRKKFFFSIPTSYAV